MKVWQSKSAAAAVRALLRHSHGRSLCRAVGRCSWLLWPLCPVLKPSPCSRVAEGIQAAGAQRGAQSACAITMATAMKRAAT